MQYFTRLAYGGTTLATLAEKWLEGAPEAWNKFTDRQTYPGSPHADTRCIPLLWPAWPGITPERVFSDLVVVSWPALQLSTELQAVLRELGPYLPGKIARAALVELCGGGEVAPHVDEGLYSSVTNRHHFAITSPAESWLWVGEDEAGEVLHAEPGELWTINKDVVHGARNASETPRIHLIVDTWRTGGLRND